jgi:hypothetical protein
VPIISGITPTEGGNSLPPDRKLRGPGKTNAVLPTSNFRGTETVPYTASFAGNYFANAAFTVPIAPSIILCDANTASFVVTLPPAASCYGRYVELIKVDSSVNTITFTPTGTDLINYYSTWTGLTKQWETVKFLSVIDSNRQARWIAMLSKPVV